MTNKYVISQSLVDQIRNADKALKNQSIVNPNIIGKQAHPRMFAKITGKTTGTPQSGMYEAVQMVTDASGYFITLSGGLTWGQDTIDVGPLVDLRSLESINGNDTDDDLQRLPTNSIVEVFYRGNENGDIVWYTTGNGDPFFDISFGTDYINDGAYKLRVHSGYIYGQNISQLVAGNSYALSGTHYIYAEYSVNLADSVITPVATLASSGSRPTEVTVTSTTRTVKTVIASIVSGEVTIYHDGDIYASNYSGFQGPQGFQGPSGVSGVSGLQGPQGFQGIQGPQGFQGNQGFQGFQGNQGFQGFQGFRGHQGHQGFQGNAGAKFAIVETSNGYNSLACLESPEILFMDIISVKHSGMYTIVAIDPMFIEVCEDDLRIVSSSCSKPFPVGVDVIGGKLVISTNNPIDAKVSCIVAGTRKGFSKVRFQKCSEQQFTNNMKFWKSIIA